MVKDLCTPSDSSALTVSVMWVRGLLQAAQQLGLDRATLLQVAGLDESQLSSPYARLSLSKNLLLWRAIEQYRPQADTGLRIGEMVKPSYFQLFSVTLLHSNNLGAAFQKSMRYTRLLSDGGQYFIVPEADQVALCYQPVDAGFSHHQVDAVLVLLRNFSSWLACRPLSLRGVEVQHAEPENIHEYQRIFSAPITFNSQRNALLFDSELLNEPLALGDDYLAAMHEQMLESQLQLLQQMDTAGKVRHILLQSENLLIEREQIAAKLHVSERSLQRKLQECGTSFQQLLFEERNQRAKQLLLHSNHSLTEISAQLGFAESSVFSRAFRRWNGVSPLEYRQQID